MKLAVLSSHPIQYQVPIWRELSRRGIDAETWYLTRHGLEKTVDREFKKSFAWDIDMMSGYKSDFMNIREPYDLSHFRGVSFKEDFASRLRKHQVDALWLEGWRFRALWQAVGVAQKQRVQVWVRGESNTLRKIPLWKQLVKKVVLGQHLRKVDEFLCIGEANRKFYRSYGISELKLHSAPYCVENDRFISQSNSLRVDRDEIRSYWGIDRNSKVVLFCGKFIDKKHPDHLLSAVSRLSTFRSRGIDWHVLFVGSGPMGQLLRKSCRVVFDAENGMGRVVDSTPINGKVKATFAGFLNQTEIAKAYVAADLMVLPSDAGETWGLVVNEAMACGTPVVTSDLVGCAQDLPSKLDPKLVYPFAKLDRLTEAIQHAATSSYGVEEIHAVVDRCHLKHTVDCVERLLSRTRIRGGD